MNFTSSSVCRVLMSYYATGELKFCDGTSKENGTQTWLEVT